MISYLKQANIFISLFSLLFIVVVFNCAYYNTLFNAKKSFNNGIKIIQKEPEKETHPQANKYFEETIEKSWKLIELYSDKSKYADDALMYIIKSEFYIGKYSQGKLHVNQFLSKYPESDLVPEANLWLGKFLIKENNDKEGREFLYKSINTSKNSRIRSESYYELGNIAYVNKNYEQAVEFFEKALGEDIDKQYAAFVQFYLGESYFAQGKYEEAIERYKKVEKFSPSLDIEYKTKFNLAKSYTEIDKYEDALKILRKMLTAPRFKNFVPQIKSEIARIYYKQNDLQAAIDLYKEVVKEKKSSPGTAIASFNLAKIYEKDTQNIDSAVYYYGEVKKIYSKFDSVESAENRHFFLFELKKIKDNIKRDQNLVYRLKNDKYFLDSLYSAQYEDSIFKAMGGFTSTETDTTTFHMDTTNTLYKLNFLELDSVKNTLMDSINFSTNDTLRKILNDSLSIINQFLLFKAPKKENLLEQRKLPQIEDDLKNNRYHIAEFFLLQNQEYDSALYYYKNFLNLYADSVLTPKALYSVYFIYSNPSKFNETKKDSLENVLISEYPATQFAKEILRRKGLLEEKQGTDSLSFLGEKYFIRAEKYYSKNELDSALFWYRNCASLDSNLIWSAKSQLAIAWIYENDLQDINQAITEYTHLSETYNQPDYQKFALMKIAIPEEKNTLTNQDTSKAVYDSTYLALLNHDSTSSQADNEIVPSIGTEGEKSTLPSVAKSKKYREWRLRRSNQ